MPSPAPSPCSTPPTSAFLPTTMAECKARGWNEVDVVFVSGDAYIDQHEEPAVHFGRRRLPRHVDEHAAGQGLPARVAEDQIILADAVCMDVDAVA